MADWEEIKRLAADFQKVQLTSTTQRLSERNCIEIITLLREKKIIDLIFTVDGKEYLTPSHLIQEIRNELYVSGGRISLIDLSKTIAVDAAHINKLLPDILDKDVQFVLGQLINSDYIAKISGEINHKLAQQGQINFSELTIQYDLPVDFLQQNAAKFLHGKQDKNDSRLYFTESFIERCKSKIRGALTGITKPTTISSILNNIDLSEKLFFSLFDQVANYGTLTSRLTGAQYVPNIYARCQNEWANNFFRQNGYLEYDAMIRLGISDYKSYIKRQFANEKLTNLNSIVVSKRVLDQIEADIEECISSKSFVDLQNALPSVFNDNDIKLALDTVLSTQKSQQIIYIENYLISRAFLDNLSETCLDFVKSKAKEAVDSGRYQKFQTELQVHLNKPKLEAAHEKIDKREERRKKATGGKSGGGTQGRETKTKSTKKLYRASLVKSDLHEENIDESIDEKKGLEIIPKGEIKKLIQSKLESESLDELIDSITDYLWPGLNERGLEIAGEIYAVTVADRTANRRQTHNELQNKLNAQIGEIRLFEKGLKLLPSDLQSQLAKYLLKTLCTDVATEILNYVSAEKNSNITTDSFNIDQKLKFVNDLPNEFKNPLLPLVKSLTGQSIDDFMNAVEDSLAACSMIVKKIDKKKDRVVILYHKHELLEQLNKCDDLALVLHLAALIIFISATQCMVHASGKFVAAILTFLKQFLSEEQFNELISYHDFVTLMLSGGSEAESAKEKLKEKVSVIKNLANEYKKSGVEKS